MEQKTKMIGMVLDVSNRPTLPSSKRIIDLVKRVLIDFVGKLDVNDCFYVYDPHLLKPVCDKGDQIALLGNYQTDGYKYNLSNAFKQTYCVLLTQDEDTECTIVYLTDRFDNESAHVKKLFNMHKTVGLLWEPCKVVVIGIGSQYNKSLLESLCRDADTTFFDTPTSRLGDVMDELFLD